MAGFIYYKPGKRNNNQVTKQEVEGWGLGYAFDDVIESRDVQGTATDNQNGFVFANKRGLGKCTLGMFPAQQAWRKVIGSECWVGVFNDFLPKPEDVARKRQLRGYMVDLADGNKWIVPLCREYLEDDPEATCVLPRYLDLDDAGNEIPGQVLGVYQHLWDATEPLAQALMGEKQDTELDLDDWALAATLLQANYLVDRTELAMLRCFDEVLPPASVGLYAIDYPSFIARIEKKTSSNPTAAA